MKFFYNHKKKLFALSFGIISSIFLHFFAYAQLPSVNINQLTDDQLITYLRKAQGAGISESKLLQEAQSRGLSAEQLQRLQGKISEVFKSGTSTGESPAVGRSLNTKLDTIGNSLPVVHSNIFGADLFRNTNITFEPNLKLATPVNYIVGPDDQLKVSVYGNSLANWTLTVSPEGTINIPGSGIVSVAGKTIEQATAAIKSRLIADDYGIGRGTSLNVTLGDIRSIKVIMIGQVIKPGTYTLPSLATAFNALSAAGGPNDNGSFRRIEIIRNSAIIRTLDVYDFLVKGDQKNNIVLRDQDIIRVPTYQNRVEITGEVKAPAIFEVVPGETLKDLISFAGGFTSQAYTGRVKVLQIYDQQRRLTDVQDNDIDSYIPLRGDVFIVDKVLDRIENRVVITGAVYRPGPYELQKGLTLLQLIKNAAGLKEDAFTGRGTITRLRQDNTTEIIAFNIGDVLNGTTDIRLQREDVVSIISLFDLRDAYKVTITGEVRTPGTFSYAENMKVADLIVIAGGFSEGASTKRIEVARRITEGTGAMTTNEVAKVFQLDVGKSLEPGQGDFALRPFDIISVFSLPGYEAQKVIKVEGEVLYPGSYVISLKGEKISSLIKRAGGLTEAADPAGGTLRRNNTAILGVNKNKVDTVALAQERSEQRSQLNSRLNNGAVEDQVRNNYVGIDLKKIIEKPGTVTDLILQDGDVLRVPMKQEVVTVNGHVLYPSAIVYQKDKTFSDYIDNAGGYAPGALKRAAYVVYPNGTVKSTHKFLFFRTHPSVRAGSEIFIPKKPEKRGLTSSDVLGFATGLASLGAIIFGIISLSR